VTISGKKICLRLPPPQITDAYLDDAKSQVIDHVTGLLRVFDKDLEQTARANAVDDIRRAARMDGIWTKRTSGRGWNWNVPAAGGF